MGVWLNKNFIEISNATSKPGTMLERYSYKDIDEEYIDAVVNDEKIKWIQIGSVKYFVSQVIKSSFLVRIRI